MIDKGAVFEGQLTSAFGAYADSAPVEVDARAMTHAARLAAGPRPLARTQAVPSRRPTGYVLIAAALLILSLVVAAVVVGSRPRDLLETTPSARPSAGPQNAFRGVVVATDPLDLSVADDAYVRLQDGGVLRFGDSWPDRRQQALWDPATRRSRPVGLSVGKRTQPIGVLLDDGRVLIIGGDIAQTSATEGTATYSTAEIYDPVAGTFTTAGPMVGKGWAPSAIRLADGRVLILDGISVDDALAPDPLLKTAEIYDPSTDTFAATGPMSIARGPASLALLDDGRVFVVGGTDPASDVAELFDPATGRFTPTASVPPAGSQPAPSHPLRPGGQYFPKVAAGAVRLPDGRVLVPGRRCIEIGDGHGPTSAAIYDPSTAIFTVSTPMPHCVETATGLPDGRVFLTGFWGDTNWSGIYDPATDSVKETAAPPAGRYIDVVGLQDGGVLVVGGGVETIFR